MKNKKIIVSIFLILVISLFLGINSIKAADDGIKFIPNVPIPGWKEIFNVTVVKDWMGNDVEAAILTGGTGIGEYINTLYIYAARIASLLAMLMLVIAAWQWLFAAGRPDKISNAKNTITGALIGLALLFGGHLLLSSISSGFVELKSIAPTGVEKVELCDIITVQAENCGKNFELEGRLNEQGNPMECLGMKCVNQNKFCLMGSTGTYEDCDYADPKNTCSCIDVCSTIDSCSDYKSVSTCRTNACYGKNNFTGDSAVCGTEIGDNDCTTLEGVDCNAQQSICTNIGININTVDYCCNKNNSGWKDECNPRSESDQCFN